MTEHQDINENGDAVCPRVPHGVDLDLLVIHGAGHKGFMSGSMGQAVTIDKRYFIEDVSEHR